MKTSVIEVRDMLSVLSVTGVEERIGKVPGVESVTVNFAAGNATVRYDETRLDIADIRSDVRQSGYETDSAPGAPPANAAPKDKAAPEAAPASPPKPAPSASADAPTPAAPKSAPAGAAMASPSAAPASGGQPDNAALDKS